MLTRRAALFTSLALPAAARIARAEGAPIPLGTILPLTGAGGAYGPSMAKVARAATDAINAAGGVLGRKLALTVEDDQTSPDAGVLAARKLIDVNRVCAIVGTWASAVTTAVAPLCWQSKTMLFTVSGADSITRLPHHGYIIRTQPNTHLQGTRAGAFLLAQGTKRMFALSVQAPFAVDSYNRIAEVLKGGGASATGDIIYDPSKTSFRSEIDEALRGKPDTLFLNSYEPDLAILLREIYQAGFNGRRVTLGYAANEKLLRALPPAVTNGLLSYSPSPDIASPAYARVQQILDTKNPDPYSCQIYDHVSLVALAIGKAGAATGLAIHDNVRTISQGGGQRVSSAVDGLKLLAAGHAVNYDGASGPCDFLPSGDIAGCKFRFDEAQAGHDKLLSVS
ncbi:MAG TPA: ABC transporter substrate-binding protein [Acetobacteraceae bacterium]|nr:ABC transporter substrate-binding protein [Acetobacteraceae bacterium]